MLTVNFQSDDTLQPLVDLKQTNKKKLIGGWNTHIWLSVPGFKVFSV